MEENIFEQPVLGDEIRLNQGSIYLLNNISKWTKFLSILGFVLIGLMVVGILATGAFISSMNHYAETAHMYPYNPGMFKWSFAVIYLIILAIYFIPLYYLYKFSTRIQKAIAMKDMVILTEAFSFLQKHYMFLGILVIVGIGISLIGFVSMIMGFAAYM